MAYPTVYLMRHGQTEWNIASRLQGRFDSALTSQGKEQAAQQGVLLKPIAGFHQHMNVLCSPQNRAQATAKIALIGLDLPYVVDDRLREISAGSWDGAFLDDIECDNGPLFEQSRNTFELMFLAPDGEGEESVLQRCCALLGDLKAPSVLITHGATLCVLRGILRGLPFDEMLDLNHEQGCIYALENGNETILR